MVAYNEYIRLSQNERRAWKAMEKVLDNSGVKTPVDAEIFEATDKFKKTYARWKKWNTELSKFSGWPY